MTPILGRDADEDLSPHAAAIKAAGIGFVFGYSRFLTKAMVEKYHAAGLMVGVFDERQATRALQGAAAGAVDGKAALTFMQAIGAPPSAAIFATVDDDVSTTAQLAAIEDYFAAYDGYLYPHFQIAGYADGTALSALRQHGLPIEDLAGAMGWNGSRAFTLSGKPHLIQGPTIGPHGGTWTPPGQATIKCPALGFSYDPQVALQPLASCGLF